MATDLVIGCPERLRQWMADQYIVHMAEALKEAGQQAHLVFIIPGNDPTDQALAEAIDKHKAYFAQLDFIYTREKPDPMPPSRHRDYQRLKLMVSLRNCLLARVRSLGPKFFLSLDSDILLAS